MHQELVLLYAQILQYHPDLVIFVDGHNDMSGVMSAPDGPYNPFTSTPHELEFDTMTRPKSLRSLFYINSQWLRGNSAFFDLLYRKALARVQPNAFGPGVDQNEPVTSPVQFPELSPADQKVAQSDLARVGYYVEAVERLQSALATAHVPALFSLQPEILTTPKRLTPIEAKFADYTRQVNQRLRTYLWEQLRPAISMQMAQAAQRDHFTFVDLEDAFRDIREKTFTDYCHMTPLGNERVAEQLYRDHGARSHSAVDRDDGPLRSAPLQEGESGPRGTRPSARSSSEFRDRIPQRAASSRFVYCCDGTLSRSGSD